MIPGKKKYFLIGFSSIFIFSIFLFLLFFFFFLPKKSTRYTNYQECDHVRFANAPIAPSNKLNDKNDIHLLHAMKNGLKKPFETDSAFYSQIDDLVRMALLVKVADNQFYKLKSLKHSQPYLIPEAIDMLNEIGFKFQERLKEKKYKNFRFLITSLLRTEEAQNKLSHRNSNASIHSSHLYGTTVDISYKNFYNTQTDSIESSYEAVQALTSVLREMREDCKFLAVRERKQSCFHITVVVCRPIDSTMND
ncbi:MAG: DUF5715 family protein [Paludibacter sp.]|jgi:hypothetical protein|nr:DUF5715 family protein [Paludibacter sp.]